MASPPLWGVPRALNSCRCASYGKCVGQLWVFMQALLCCGNYAFHLHARCCGELHKPRFVCACFGRRVGRRQFRAGLWLLSHVACCLPPLAVPRLCRVIHVTPTRVNALRIRCAFKCTTPASATRTHMPTAAATQLQSLSMPTNPAKYRTNRLQALPAFNIDSICMRGWGHI